MSERLLALYRGDEHVMVGTVAELAERMGVSRETVRWHATPSARRRTEGSRGWHVEVVS